jgi:hypothetical protein
MMDSTKERTYGSFYTQKSHDTTRKISICLDSPISTISTNFHNHALPDASLRLETDVIAIDCCYFHRGVDIMTPSYKVLGESELDNRARGLKNRVSI